jgi:hypothetical protein
MAIYKVTEPDQDYGLLNEFIVTTDEKGRFGLTIDGLKGEGDRHSSTVRHF